MYPERAEQILKWENREKKSQICKVKKCLYPGVTAENQNVKQNQTFYLVGSIDLLLELDTLFAQGETLQISD